jgi:hypothetical protein
MNKFFTPFALSAVFTLAISESKASEFFVKINRTGQHTVLVHDQYQTNNNNVYRFFDLPVGSVFVKIGDANTGNMIFDGTITMGTDERVVAEVSANGSMTIITTVKVAYDNWYTPSGQTVVNNPNTQTPPPPPPPPAPIGVSNEKFNEIVSIIKSQTVESYKLDKAKTVAKKNMFSVKQVAEICNLFKVESYKLEFAKFAYDYTVDKDNYYIIGKVFKVASYSKELDDYVDKKQ